MTFGYGSNPAEYQALHGRSPKASGVGLPEGDHHLVGLDPGKQLSVQARHRRQFSEGVAKIRVEARLTLDKVAKEEHSFRERHGLRVGARVHGAGRLTEAALAALGDLIVESKELRGSSRL